VQNSECGKNKNKHEQLHTPMKSKWAMRLKMHAKTCTKTPPTRRILQCVSKKHPQHFWL